MCVCVGGVVRMRLGVFSGDLEFILKNVEPLDEFKTRLSVGLNADCTVSIYQDTLIVQAQI